MDRIDAAFKAIDRRDFLPPDKREYADIDRPIQIGYGQTNSQPSTVRQMLEWLDPQPGDKVLDVGSGSGWTTALLAHLVGHEGEVYAVERVPELLEFGAANCARLNIPNARFFDAESTFGLAAYAPFDRILVSASADHLPTELLGQLKDGGRMVIPIQESIHVIDRRAENDFKDTEHPGFVFVPLIR